MTHLTDLEGAALAEIARRGTATSYAVANAFSGSPSEFWSGSAGAVYPMIRRLTEKGYLQVHAAATGKRRKSDYSITDSGRAALEQWLLDDARAAGMGFDPLRTRLLYLDLVTLERGQAFLAAVAARSADESSPPVFAGRSDAQRIHQSWWTARRAWLASILQWRSD